jgi:pimeloyl-ACP methyl ester carboxylesterase
MPTWTHPATATTLAYDDRGVGPPLVLVHAFPLDRRMWDAQAEALSATHRVLTPDVFGFGGSGLPAGGWTVDSMADTLADWLTALGVEQVVIGGLSMGGYITLAFARRHANRVSGLILADTRADADTAEAKANREKTITMVEEKGSAALIEQMLPKMVCDATRTNKPNVIEAVRSLATAQTVPGVTAALRALRDRPDSTPDLDGYRFPVLVVVGRDDAITPPELSKAMVAKLPTATYEVLPDAGHLANLETPAEFTAAVRRWLR